MMYMIDAHILLWWLFDDRRLSSRLKGVIKDDKNNISVSVITVWEVILKQSLGKLKAPDDLIKSIESDGFEILALDIEHITRLTDLPFIHRDPFDRLLIAQAIAEDYTIITVDKYIKQYEVKTLS